MNRPEASSRVLKALAILWAVHGRSVDGADKSVANAYADDLAYYPEPQVIAALERCRRELRTFPTIADIIARIEDGRPGAEEAWAMIPKDEIGSVVWTDEMRDAYGVARRLIAEDLVAARMAFRETYLRLVADARSRMVPTRWTPTLGHDVGARAEALQAAVYHRRLTPLQANSLLPGYEDRAEAHKLLTHQKDQEADLTGLSEFIDTILANAPEGIRRMELARRRIGFPKTDINQLGPLETARLKEEQLKKLEQKSDP